MTASIFVRTFRSDRFWADYMLRSLEKFATGFAEIVVAIPIGDEPHFEHTDFHGARVVWIQDPDCSGYVAQQNCKAEADTHCSGDAILYLDSDCFVTAPMTPEMFMSNGRPIQLLRHWRDMDENAAQWFEITTGIIGFEPTFESMSCHPIVYDRRTLPLFREHIQHTHKMPLREFVKTIKENRMSEFNAIGALAHRFQPFLYDFRISNPATDGYPRIVKQQWSWNPLGVEPFKEEYEKILAS